MTIQKSETYTHDQNTRKVFAKLHTEMTSLGQMVEQLLTLGNGMRLALAGCSLTLADIEHRHVSQSQDKRRSDSLLHEASTRLADYIAREKMRLGEILPDTVSKCGKVISDLKTQADRIANDRGIIDTEADAQVEGVEYVGIDYFCEQLGAETPLAAKTVRKLIEQKRLPIHKCTQPAEERGRPKMLWVKSEAVLAVQAFLREHKDRVNRKKGIAALV